MIKKLQFISFTLTIILLFFCFTCICYILPNCETLFGTIPERNSNPFYWYTFLTYPFVHDGLFHWLREALFLFAIGIIIELRLQPKLLIKMVVGSVTIYGFLLTILSEGDLPVYGGTAIIYGYIGTLLAITIKFYRTYTKLEIGITALVILFVISGLFYLELVIYQSLYLTSSFAFLITYSFINKNGLELSNSFGE